MKLKKTLKSVALVGMTFAAGFGAYHATHSKSEKGYTAPEKAKTYEGTTVISHQKTTYDSYEIRAGVLMPLPGETTTEYEARRVRLEKQENQLRLRMVSHYQERLAALRSQGANPRIITAVEDRLEELQKNVRYLSYITPEGQKKLKTFNENRCPINGRQLRQGDMCDF